MVLDRHTEPSSAPIGDIIDLVKKIQEKVQYFFVDESGDPTFYNRRGKLILGKEGVSQILILGFIKTTDPKPIRKALLNLQKEISEDEYLKGIPSIKKSLVAFHAKDDSPEIREKVFKTIVKLDFTAEIFVGRKIEALFKKRHHKTENEFYDDLISKLFENKLHLNKYNEIFFAIRGSKTRQIPLKEAIEKAREKFNVDLNIYKTKVLVESGVIIPIR